MEKTDYLRMMEERYELEEMAVNQLLDAFDGGYMNEKTIGEFSYFHLAALLHATEEMENGKDLFLKAKSYLENINVRRLQGQEKIVIGFIANYSSTWIGDELYLYLEQSQRFEPYVFLISNYNGQSMELVKEEYARNLIFFRERGLRVVQTLDLESGRQYTWEEMGVKPQVCIWLTPWIDLFREHFHLLHYSLDVLHTYIPYGFLIAENEKNDFVQHQYNQIIHNVAWQNFEEGRFSVGMAEKYAFVGKENVTYTGYPKMDVFFEAEEFEDAVWKGIQEKSGLYGAKKIIYAPHHALGDDEPVCFSTFASNYLLMLDLAEKYQEHTIWAFKPHPQLKYKAIRSGLFKDSEEWEKYVGRWRALKNADVVEAGDYRQLFRHSDAMILDSVSFLAEYLYVHKPLLFLRGSKQRFNEFGRQLMEIHYCADGDDADAIQHFIEDKVLKERDEMYEKREHFFDSNLNYVQANGYQASRCIYEWLCSELEQRYTFWFDLDLVGPRLEDFITKNRDRCCVVTAAQKQNRDVSFSQLSFPCVVVGDNVRAAEMMASAQIGIGFGRVQDIAPEVLDCADYIINDEDKMVEFLKRLLEVR